MFYLNQPTITMEKTTKLIPVYPTGCSCFYGYMCDDPDFDWTQPVEYKEVDINDPRTYAMVELVND